MTDDLLGKIFYHVCDPGPLSLRHLLFVSRRFYSATMNNAHLWTTISFDLLFARHFYQWHEQGNRFVEQCLLLSGLLPLCLYIKYYGFIAPDPTYLLHPLETFGKPEWRGLQRCTSLIWDNDFQGSAITRKIVAMFPKSFPALKYISLSRLYDSIDGSQFPNCPVVERVEMLSHRQPSPAFWGTNFLHVTTLSFGNYSQWDHYDMATLSLFPMLHDLTLSTEHGGGRGLCGQLPISFACLQTLRVHGYIASTVLIKLVAPALKELHIKADVQHSTSIYSLPNSFEPHCQHIYALLPMAVSAKEPEWAKYLSKLVQKCTRIKSLYLSKWMEQECNKFMSGHDNIVLHVQ
jgi:hypothetical protein